MPCEDRYIAINLESSPIVAEVETHTDGSLLADHLLLLFKQPVKVLVFKQGIRSRLIRPREGGFAQPRCGWHNGTITALFDKPAVCSYRTTTPPVPGDTLAKPQGSSTSESTALDQQTVSNASTLKRRNPLFDESVAVPAKMPAPVPLRDVQTTFGGMSVNQFRETSSKFLIAPLPLADSAFSHYRNDPRRSQPATKDTRKARKRERAQRVASTASVQPDNSSTPLQSNKKTRSLACKRRQHDSAPPVPTNNGSTLLAGTEADRSAEQPSGRLPTLTNDVDISKSGNAQADKVVAVDTLDLNVDMEVPSSTEGAGRASEATVGIDVGRVTPSAPPPPNLSSLNAAIAEATDVSTATDALTSSDVTVQSLFGNKTSNPAKALLSEVVSKGSTAPYGVPLATVHSQTSVPSASIADGTGLDSDSSSCVIVFDSRKKKANTPSVRRSLRSNTVIKDTTPQETPVVIPDVKPMVSKGQQWLVVFNVPSFNELFALAPFNVDRTIFKDKKVQFIDCRSRLICCLDPYVDIFASESWSVDKFLFLRSVLSYRRKTIDSILEPCDSNFDKFAADLDAMDTKPLAANFVAQLVAVFVHVVEEDGWFVLKD
uniref:ULP_PROTEASE domain-containing protein n=1 Tax=Panagrellus redivivus TaxID=6233 RepID=A0A7E4V5C3_PANRE